MSAIFYLALSRIVSSRCFALMCLGKAIVVPYELYTNFMIAEVPELYRTF